MSKEEELDAPLTFHSVNAAICRMFSGFGISRFAYMDEDGDKVTGQQ